MSHVVSIYKLQIVFFVFTRSWHKDIPTSLHKHTHHLCATDWEPIHSTLFVLQKLLISSLITLVWLFAWDSDGEKYKAFFSVSFECTCSFVQQMNNIIMLNQGIMESKVEWKLGELIQTRQHHFPSLITLQNAHLHNSNNNAEKKNVNSFLQIQN